MQMRSLPKGANEHKHIVHPWEMMRQQNDLLDIMTNKLEIVFLIVNGIYGSKWMKAISLF